MRPTSHIWLQRPLSWLLLPTTSALLSQPCHVSAILRDMSTYHPHAWTEDAVNLWAPTWCGNTAQNAFPFPFAPILPPKSPHALIGFHLEWAASCCDVLDSTRCMHCGQFIWLAMYSAHRSVQPLQRPLACACGCYVAIFPDHLVPTCENLHQVFKVWNSRTQRSCCQLAAVGHAPACFRPRWAVAGSTGLRDPGLPHQDASLTQ